MIENIQQLPKEEFMGTIAGDYNRQHSVNRRKSPAIDGDHAEAYCKVMSTWPSMMVDTAEGDLPKLFSLNKGDLSLIFIQRHRLNYFNHTHAHARKRARARKHVHTRAASTRTRMHAHARARAHAQARTHAQARAHAHASTRTCAQESTRTHTRARTCTRKRINARTRLRVHARVRLLVRACACARAW